MERIETRLVPALWITVSVWAQSPPERPWFVDPPVRSAAPDVRDVAWARSDLDRFVLARLEAAGLSPSREADRTTLLRRVTLDLTGLPPTREALEAFLADSSPDAYERVVDRLLASQQHGERMAQWWLDLARYTETCGFDFDPEREVWAYRDWVVQAFADDMPYDRFTREQLAGDLLPSPTRSERIATGFQRLHALNLEEEGQPGEYRHQYVADRTATFGATWLGLTIGCAECHDHKFDPISQRDYYGLYAFWNRMDERGLSSDEATRAEPFVELPTPEQATELLELEREIEAARRTLGAAERARAGERERWLAARTADAHVLPRPLLAIDCDDLSERCGRIEGLGDAKVVEGVRGAAIGLDGRDVFLQLGQQGELDVDRPFTATAWVRIEPREFGGAQTVVGKLDEAEDGRGWGMIVRDDGLLEVMLVAAEEQALEARARRPITYGRWHHVAFGYDGSRRPDGLTLFVDGERVEARTIGPGETPDEEPDDEVGDEPKDAKVADAPRLEGDLVNQGNLRVGAIDGSPLRGRVDEVRLFDRALADAELAAMVLADFAAMTGVERHELGQRLFTRHGDPGLRELDDSLAALVRRRDRVREDVSALSVMRDAATPRETHLLARGDFLSPREVVEPAIPAVLGALPEHAPRDRRGLADWLVHPDNPIVARVHVNRLWSWFFGQGLVATPGDFGTRGAAPSHPLLLDWLAREFVESGFRHRAFVRMLVTSATYRQRSDWREDLAAVDPDNRLLGRANRWRLDAEALRDQALEVAGLLDKTIGGPSVMPWQPEDLWPKPSKPEARRRRGLYVAVKRGVPFAAFQLFDMPTREVCTVARDRTTTPLQALTLLNDRNSAEAARGLAERVLRERADDQGRMERAFALCTLRCPTPAEREVLVGLLDAMRASFRADRERAAAAAAVGDLPTDDGLDVVEVAAWSAVSAVLLNLDEVMCRR